MDIVVWLNVLLGLLLTVASLYYCRRLGQSNWRSVGAIVVGCWVTVAYLIRLFFVPELMSHGVWGNWMVRPAFTFILIIMTAKAVASAKRVKVYADEY